MTDLITQLKDLGERATKGPWEIQDGSSWRRIGTAEQDGAVLYPTTYSQTDGHPDLSAARGNDLYANLKLIVLLRNNLPTIIQALEAQESASREGSPEGDSHD